MSGSGLLAGASRSTGVVLPLASLACPALPAGRAGRPPANDPGEAALVVADAAFTAAIGFSRSRKPLPGS